MKTATRRYPKGSLSRIELQQRGDHSCLVHRQGGPHRKSVLAIVWMDRERRYFIATAGSMATGIPYNRTRWRQVHTTPDAEPEQVDLVVSQPVACELYYSTCAAVNQHNRSRQANLNIENKLKTHNWAMRVNLSIFSICAVDAWKVYSQAKPCLVGEESEKQFYGHLAEELIENKFDGQVRPHEHMEQTRSTSSGMRVHLSPTKKKRSGRNRHANTKFKYQGRCNVCGQKTTWVCSVCCDARAKKK